MSNMLSTIWSGREEHGAFIGIHSFALASESVCPLADNADWYLGGNPAPEEAQTVTV